MKTVLLCCALFLSSPAWADTLDFEVGGRTGQLLNTITPNYGGAGWDFRWAVLDHQAYESTWGNTIAFPSGEQVAFNGFGTDALTIDGPGMTVIGAWFAPWTAFNAWYDPFSAHAVTMEEYTGTTLVGSTTLQLDPTRFLFLAPAFSGPIDTLRIVSSSGDRHWFLMDNLGITVPPVIIPPDGGGTGGGSSVPEPATWLLLLPAIIGGCVGLAVREWWRKR